MERLHNGFTLNIPQGTFPLSTDSIALSGFAKLPQNSLVLDLGSGCGTLGLLLCANHSSCKVTGVELDITAHNAALENIADNKLEHRLTSICADLRSIPSFLQAGSYHCCVSNPPYFTAGPQSKTVPLARQEAECSIEDLFQSAGWSLKYGGDFFLVHRPERLAELFATGAAHNLIPKRLCLLRHRSNGPVALVLIQFRKGANHGLVWEEESFYDDLGQPTQYYRNLYHL